MHRWKSEHGMRRHDRMAILRANCSIKYRAPHSQMWAKSNGMGRADYHCWNNMLMTSHQNEKSFLFLFIWWGVYDVETIPKYYIANDNGEIPLHHPFGIFTCATACALDSHLLAVPSIDWKKHSEAAPSNEKCDNFRYCCCLNDTTRFMLAYSLHFSLNGCDINVVIKYTWSAQYLSLMAVIICALFRCASCQNVAINRMMCTQYSLSTSPTYLSYFIQSIEKEREREKKAIFSPP